MIWPYLTDELWIWVCPKETTLMHRFGFLVPYFQTKPHERWDVKHGTVFFTVPQIFFCVDCRQHRGILICHDMAIQMFFFWASSRRRFGSAWYRTCTRFTYLDAVQGNPYPLMEGWYPNAACAFFFLKVYFRLIVFWKIYCLDPLSK